LKEYKGFEIDPTTGFPICPKTRKFIDGIRPYCNSCFTLDVKNTRIFQRKKEKAITIMIRNKFDT